MGSVLRWWRRGDYNDPDADVVQETVVRRGKRGPFVVRTTVSKLPRGHRQYDTKLTDSDGRLLGHEIAFNEKRAQLHHGELKRRAQGRQA